MGVRGKMWQVVKTMYEPYKRLVNCLDKGSRLHEGQAGFRVDRSVWMTYALNELLINRCCFHAIPYTNGSSIS